jgi:hypothetical protein
MECDTSNSGLLAQSLSRGLDAWDRKRKASKREVGSNDNQILMYCTEVGTGAGLAGPRESREREGSENGVA